MGTEEFASVFNTLWPKASTNDIRLCVRHWVAIQPAERVRLSGYGVQLAVKSTEYRAVDDTKVQEGGSQECTCMYSTVHVVCGV